ncbi:MAG: hypothetical protein ACJ74H_15185 [Thermoanaerobaculia bacterium]
MRRLAIAFTLLLASLSAFAATPPSWGSLDRGPYAAGYRLIDRYDYSRPYWTARDLDGKPRRVERARPMRVSVWYPATPSDAPSMTLGDYIDLMGAETSVVPIGEEQKRAGRAALYAFQFLRSATPEQRAKLESLAMAAQRDAKPAAGKFPLILYSLGSAALAAVTPEYLASHGYVVVQMPRLGEFAGMPPDGPTDTQAKVDDTEFMLQVAHEIPAADLDNLGAIGFSAGGRWALSAAMRNPDVHAVVSLDTVMLFHDAAARNWQALPFYDLNAVRVPVLHMIRRAWVPQQDAAAWEAMRNADRTMLIFEDPKLDHFDFQSIGYALTLAGMRPDAAAGIADTFERFHRLTLAFLDAHLKHDAKAAEALRAPLPPTIVATHAAGAAQAPQLIDVMNAVAERSVDSALKAVQRAAAAGTSLALPEDVVNLAGYNLLGTGRAADAMRMFELNVEAHPQSANAYDSLADAYVASGDRAKAAELARKAQTLLDADTAIAADRKEAIRASIQQKLAER